MLEEVPGQDLIWTESIFRERVVVTDSPPSSSDGASGQAVLRISQASVLIMV